MIGQGAFSALTAVLVETTSPGMHADVLQAMCNLTAVQPVTAAVSPTVSHNVLVSDELAVPEATIAALVSFGCSSGACLQTADGHVRTSFEAVVGEHGGAATRGLG